MRALDRTARPSGWASRSARGALVLALVPGCLLAPDRPGGDPVSGEPIAVDPPGCLDPNQPLPFSAVGPLPDGRDGLFRADATDGAPRIYEFLPTMSPPGCYALAFSLPVPPGARVLAIDVAVRAGQSVITAMVESSHELAFAEVTLDGMGGAVGSTIGSTLAIAPDVVSSSDEPVPTRPRFLRRMPVTEDLWFGGGAQIGVLGEASPGVLGAPVFYGVAATPAQAWLDAFPLPAQNGGNTAAIVGEAITCAAHEVVASHEVACVQSPAIRAAPCSQNACNERDAHVLRDAAGYVGFSVIQTATRVVDIELVTADLLRVEPTLSPRNLDDFYALDVALASRSDNDLDAAVLWFDDALAVAEVVRYAGAAHSTSTPIAGNRGVTSDAEQLLAGHFSGPMAGFLVIGPTAGDVSCLGNEPTLAACP